LDLNGLAKGFIVDCVANWLCERLGETEGSVNAGGDIRFLSDNDNAVSVRVGSSTAPIVRGIKLAKRAFASSSLSASRSGRSTAVYTKKLRKGLSENCVVSTLANNCMTADGLTKIVLFSETSTIEHCCREFEAEALIFGEHGELLEHFGGL
jgi:thiamine biosynthesis lipoprotein